MTHIQHINSSTPALFTDTIRAFQVIQALGKGALDIAVVSADGGRINEQRVLEIAEVIAQNQENPGDFAEYVLKVKRANKKGQEINVIRDGKVKRALVHWAGQSGNLMRGMTRRQLAKFFKMAPTDSRLTQITKGIEVALFNSLGVRAGWLDGRFRILTAKQVERKQLRRKAQITGLVKQAEADQKFIEARGAQKLGRATFQITLFAELPEVADAITLN